MENGSENNTENKTINDANDKTMKVKYDVAKTSAAHEESKNGVDGGSTTALRI